MPDEPDAAPADLVDALVRTSFAVMAVLTRVAAEHDLSLTQLRVLAVLRDRPLRVTALADHLGLEKSTMSGLVDRADKRGLLVRAPGERDRRAVDVRLSAAGEELVDRVRADVERALDPVAAALAPAERRRLRALLAKALAR
ncbi:MarR family winged helix-turn-helix transcriptional regulator [Actinokineospora bangkokensis]|uniref:MarR family transcriptional regulator n=1 Tax=Actinokineospora bangkokensis TaxID=1193682 RepID=A0A1Q9LRZ6_9PSEU|nr:MarR family transcriptional regulator [Actinokineospora bangkokensis]OLR94774.1 MarR family transcriptional regulator [Actinokineospora bangkokensis]